MFGATVWFSYAGSSRSWVKYTLIRLPSRMVMVGVMFRKRSSAWVLDCDKLAAMPDLYASLPLW